MRIAKEFKLHAILDLATEGYLMSDALTDAKSPVIVHPTMQRVSTLETYNSALGRAAFLADRKIPLAIGTAVESYVLDMATDRIPRWLVWKPQAGRKFCAPVRIRPVGVRGGTRS